MNKTQVKSAQLGITLDLNLNVYSFPSRDKVKCGGKSFADPKFVVV